MRDDNNYFKMKHIVNKHHKSYNTPDTWLIVVTSCTLLAVKDDTYYNMYAIKHIKDHIVYGYWWYNGECNLEHCHCGCGELCRYGRKYIYGHKKQTYRSPEAIAKQVVSLKRTIKRIKDSGKKYRAKSPMKDKRVVDKAMDVRAKKHFYKKYGYELVSKYKKPSARRSK